MGGSFRIKRVGTRVFRDSGLRPLLKLQEIRHGRRAHRLL